MRAPRSLVAAVAAATASSIPGAAAALAGTYGDPKTLEGRAPSPYEYGDGDPLKALEDRELFLTPADRGGSDAVDTIVFDECLGRPAPACRRAISQAIRKNRAVFGFPVRDVNFSGIPVRSNVDEGYNKVFVRTDETGQYAVGILGDGMVFYPFPWQTSATESITLGPWDCEPGDAFLTVQACCDLITADQTPDVIGNVVTCEASYPIGSPQNPRDENRVIIHVNEDNIVVHPPRLE